MIIPMNYTHLGYDFLDKVSPSQKHSGVDLNDGRPNDDLGKPVMAMTHGVVVFAKNTGKGWGNLIVIYHAAYGVWSRYGHLQDMSVKLGDKVKEGQVIGTCGATGGTWSPHLHWDVIIKELPRWTKYTSWMSVAAIEEYYTDPIEYVAKNNELDNIEDPIVTWHKNNGIITKWNPAPTSEEIKLGWAIYKLGKAIVNKSIDKSSFYL